MKNILKLSNFLSIFIVLSIFSAAVLACGGGGGCPTCGECQSCQNSVCVNNCLSSLGQTCVNGNCMIAIIYTYDAVGNKTSMTDPNGTTSYTYDYLNRPISVTNPDLKTINYQYDAIGNRTQLTDPAGNITKYSYDNKNRLIEVNAPAGSTTYQYNSMDYPIRMDYPNGTYTQYTYNAQRNWLVSLVNKDSNDAVLSSYGYTYDDAGNKLSVTENDGSVVNYGYDDTYQLTSEIRTGTNPYAITYQYDAAGNRNWMVKNGITTSYTYNNNNQLLTETTGGTTVTYSYDLNGNLLSKVSGTDTTAYTWNWNNLLLSVSQPNGTTVYEYDGGGIRISKTQNGTKTKYIKDVAIRLAQVLMETNSDGNTLATYTYGKDLISMNRADANSYYHYDGLGSARQLTNPLGAVTASYTYDSFGNLIASSGATANAYGFTGEQQFEEADGLVFLRARYYDSKVGKFISRDPLGYADSMNLYAYVKNNPINYTDPSGQISPHAVACGICAAMYLKDIGFLLYDCIKEAKKAKCDKGDAFTDCLKDHWKDAFISDSKIEEIIKDVSCFICLRPILFPVIGPFPIIKPVPIPISI